MKKKFIIFVSATILAMTSLAAFVEAHSGGTDKLGCHYNRKTGVYHCH